MRTAARFSQKLHGKVVVLLRTAARFSQKHFFKNHPSGVSIIITHSQEVPTTLTQFMQMDRRTGDMHTACTSELEEEIEKGPINSDSPQSIDGTT